jgi:N-acetylneuraminate synthase
MNLSSIPALVAEFGVPVGLSDHTLDIAVPVAAVALGACILEKHLTAARSVPGPDSKFSLEPAEFKATVDAIRIVEKAMGKPSFGPTEREAASKVFRKSLFVVENVKAGELFTSLNVRPIRPGAGLPPKHYDEILGKKATRDLERGTPLDWTMIA